MFTHAFEYKQWADERTLQAIATIDRTTHTESYSFVLQQINHMVIIEELFHSRLTNKPAPHNSTNTKTVPDLNELSKRLNNSNKWYSSHVSSLDNEEKTVKFTFADGNPGMMTTSEILFHILSHGSYHRGNIARALDLASVPHPIDGYAVYIHEKEPERRDATLAK